MEATKLKFERREELGHEIVQMIDSATSSVVELRDRWKANEDLYYLRPYQFENGPLNGKDAFHFGLMKEKLDSLTANITTLMMEGSPLFVYKMAGEGSNNTDVVEKSVQFLFKQADFERYIKIHAKLTGLNGKAAIRATFKVRAKGFHADQESSSNYAVSGLTTDNIAYCGLDLKVIHLGDLVVYPVESSEIVEARMTGHIYFLRKADVHQLQKTKEYYDDVTEFASSDKQSEMSGRDEAFDGLSTDSSTCADDDLVKCYSVVVKLDLNDDGQEKFYEINLAYNERFILSMSEFEYDRPWYYCPCLEYEYNSFYPSGCVAQSLQGLNLAQNYLMAMYFIGTLSRAFPKTVVEDSGGRLADDMMDGEAGDIFNANGAPNIAVIQSQFDPQTFPTMNEWIDNAAERLVRVSRASSTQPFRRGTTATEVSSIQQAAAISGNDYLTNYTGSELCALADHVRQMAYENFDILKMVYGDQFPADSAEQLVGGGIWEVAARSPSRTPIGRQQSAMNLLTMATTIPQVAPFIDIEELVRSIVADSDLPNADKIFVSTNELQAKLSGLAPGGGPLDPLNGGMAGMGGMAGGFGGGQAEGDGGYGPIEPNENGAGAGSYMGVPSAVG
jgi:hypothetical protein